MSENIIKLNERREGGENEVPDETLSLPQAAYEGKAYNANWHDDIPGTVKPEDKNELDFQDSFSDDDRFGSHANKIVSREAENRVSAFKRVMEKISNSEELSREDYQALGKPYVEAVVLRKAS